jgi:hypothetical protein
VARPIVDLKYYEIFTNESKGRKAMFLEDVRFTTLPPIVNEAFYHVVSKA